MQEPDGIIYHNKFQPKIIFQTNPSFYSFKLVAQKHDNLSNLKSTDQLKT